ncbi:LPS export ABC transporter periplasmic protein LptC [Vannielia litorea]|uniref:LPS export ABC transporter periplasmic protein LptC n=1 Tax=Vannielia litorea TaxID=1217970 RepID=UPI001C95C348|nr:LPS export ABC transporter periplasmic protein LptC [Vannielia litorea]MBY6049482.1 LPS export ABC transporter periplasmic protein LptC [Vannielia litorea]MBY6076896.1 LPS export ABC transporter periplasmic protein LptC [Vannielia litorea]
MSVYDNSYSRFVSMAKIVLPLAALAMLSTLFLVARTVDPTRSIPYADVDVNELAREQRISAPNYSGVTRDGSAISIAASTARPDPDNEHLVSATDLSAKLETEGGATYELFSLSGQIDTEAGQAVLNGGVIITTPTGYRVTSEEITTALERTEIESPGPVQAEGPAGVLDAGSMRLARAEEGDEASGYLLVFNGGVKLVYTPPSE